MFLRVLPSTLRVRALGDLTTNSPSLTGGRMPPRAVIVSCFLPALPSSFSGQKGALSRASQMLRVKTERQGHTGSALPTVAPGAFY